MTAPDCPAPTKCRVPDPGSVDLRRLRIVRLDEDVAFHTAYARHAWPDLFNRSPRGNARFSPLVVDGGVVPTLYGAHTQTVALLETAFHDVHATTPRVVSEALDLSRRGLVTVRTPTPLPLVDLTDDALARLGLGREQLVATTPAHYPCTREWAAALHRRRIGGVAPVGLLWQSRVAELAGADSPLLEDLLAVAGRVWVLFGDRLPTGPAAWRPGEPHHDDLTTGEGRLLVEQIAEQLGAVIVPG